MISKMKTDRRRMVSLYLIQSRQIGVDNSELTFTGVNKKGTRVEFVVVLTYSMLVCLIITHISKLKNSIMNSIASRWNSLNDTKL